MNFCKILKKIVQPRKRNKTRCLLSALKTGNTSKEILSNSSCNQCILPPLKLKHLLMQ